MRSNHACHGWLGYALLTGVVGALAGCSTAQDEHADGVQTCMPNAPVACTCASGVTSTAQCLADGSGTAPCACMAAPDAGTSSQTNGAMAGGSDAAPPIDAGRSDAGIPSVADAAAGDPMSSGEGGTSTAGPAQPSAGCGKANPPPSGSTMIDVAGTQRQFIVKVPADYDANRPYRLVFAWHGLGGTAMQIASTYYGLATRSANSAIFIAAQGLPNPQQNNLAAWANQNDGDITFTRSMLDWAKASYCIDEKRVFSIGMSNGGMMSNIVGCELGGVFRAIAAMSGGGPRGYAMKPCMGQVGVWISHGSRDNNVPFSYGQMSRDYWLKTNHCGTQTMPVMPGSCVEYQGCDAAFPVQFCEFDGGHMVPSFTGEAAWKFFERF